MDAHNAFRRAFDHHGDMADPATIAEKDQITRHHVFQGNFIPLRRLRCGTGRYGHFELLQDETGKTGTVEARSGGAAGVMVRNADEILGVTGNIFPKLHDFGGVDGPSGGWFGGGEGGTKKDGKKGQEKDH